MCLVSAVSSPFTAYAEEAEINGYPDIIREPLKFQNLIDYAVGENGVVFADGEKLILWTPDELTFEYEIGPALKSVDYEDGVYYYSNGGETYILPDSPDGLPGETAEHDFSEPTAYNSEDGEYYYTYDEENVFYVLHKSTRETFEFKDFKQVKQYNNVLYSVNNNELYSIEAERAEKKDYYYSNFYLLTQVGLGNALETLRTFSDKPCKVTISEGSSLTEFKLDEITIDNEHFNIKEPMQNTHNDISGGALLLADTGETQVVAIGSKTYILNKSGVTVSGEITFQPIENAKAAPNIEEYAHSLPFTSDSTRIFKILPTDSLKVISLIPKAQNPELAHDFYLVEKESPEGGVRGYVEAEFLNSLEYPEFNEGGSTFIPDPAPQNDDHVKTVVLILVIILLILIAAGYMTWLITTHKSDSKPKQGANPDGVSADSPKINSSDKVNIKK